MRKFLCGCGKSQLFCGFLRTILLFFQSVLRGVFIVFVIIFAVYLRAVFAMIFAFWFLPYFLRYGFMLFRQWFDAFWFCCFAMIFLTICEKLSCYILMQLSLVFTFHRNQYLLWWIFAVMTDVAILKHGELWFLKQMKHAWLWKEKTGCRNGQLLS